MPQTPLVIDLSHHNVIPHDLNDTRAAGIAGIIHKATEGTKGVDPKCRARYSLAKDAGMLFGIYHFLRPGYIKQQADHFLSTPIWDADTVLVCDFEVDGISLDAVLLFLELVESASSQRPVLYSGATLKDLGGAAKLKELADYRLWLAQYGPRATLPKGFSKYWLWQYSEKGNIAGVDGAVDLNTYNGTEQQLKQDWVIKTSAAASGNSQTDSAVSGANSDPQETDSQAQPPITTSVEQTQSQATDANTGASSTSSETKVTAEIPKGDPPETPPVQVSSGKWFSYIISGFGGAGGLATAIWGWMGSNLNAVGIGLICLTLIILALMFRKAILDAIRMQAASDPDKKNVT